MDFFCKSERSNYTECQQLLERQTAFSGELMFLITDTQLSTFDLCKRFGVIYRGKFYLFKTKMSHRAESVLSLKNVTIITNSCDFSKKSPSLCFEILATTGKPLRFIVSSEGDKQAWIKELNLNMKNEFFCDDSDYEEPDELNEHLEERNSIKNKKNKIVTKLNSYNNNFKNSTPPPKPSVSKTNKVIGSNSEKSTITKSNFEKAYWKGTAEKAQKLLLLSKVNGTFLIRNSSSGDPFLKTLMVLHNGTILKYSIAVSETGKCIMAGKEFQSGDDLLKHFTDNLLPGFSVKLWWPIFNFDRSAM